MHVQDWNICLRRFCVSDFIVLDALYPNPGISHDITYCSYTQDFPRVEGLLQYWYHRQKPRIFSETTRYLVLLNMCVPNPDKSTGPNTTANRSYNKSCRYTSCSSEPYGFTPEGKFLVPGRWIYNRIGLSHRASRLHRPYARVDYIPQSRTKNLATGLNLPVPGWGRGRGVWGAVVTNGATGLIFITTVSVHSLQTNAKSSFVLISKKRCNNLQTFIDSSSFG